MAENDLISRQEATELIKEDYRTDISNFVDVMVDLRRLGLTPAAARSIVIELIKEKHNANLDN